jgi:hypothetical protein
MASPASGSNTTPAIAVEYCLLPRVIDLGMFSFAVGLYCLGTTQLHAERLYIASASTASTTWGVFIDGTTQNVSAHFFHCNAIFTTTNTTVGFEAVGAHISDLHLGMCEGDQATYGFFYDGSSSAGPTDQLNIHLVQFVADECIYGAWIQNTTQPGGMINIDGFWWANNNSNGITVSNANGVHIRGAQLYSLHPTNSVGIYIQSGSHDCSITQSVFKGQFINMILIDSASSYMTIFGNTLVQSITNAGSIGMHIGGANVSIVGNMLRGISGTSVMANGIYLENTAINIMMGNNMVEPANVTTPYTPGTGTGIVKTSNIGF